MIEEKSKRFITPKDIELRSESVQEILGHPPRWIIRWGITIIFTVIVGLIIGSYFFKYPDIVKAKITVFTENLPANVIVRKAGRIDTLCVKEKQIVQQGDLLAVIDNPASLSAVLYLKDLLISGSVLTMNLQKIHLQLGDLQSAYQQFVKALEDYQYFIHTDYYSKKILVLGNLLRNQKDILQNTKRQLSIFSHQLEAARIIYEADSTLYAKKAMSNIEFQNTKNNYLQHRQAYENTLLNIDDQNISLLQTEQNVLDLEREYHDRLNQLELTLNTTQNQLLSEIKIWEQTYLLFSPIDGVATLTKYWQKNQNIEVGEVLVTIVPIDDEKMIGKILLPQQSAGKVKEGQMVNVKLDNYPYIEFGMLRVQIKYISLVPVATEDNRKAYMLEVDFPNKLKTNYGKELSFSQEMIGTAEIITDDIRLLNKFLNPMKSLLKK